ncbi:MAG: hypothetical protein Greene041679_34 [Parcubacteria group bacterium Greene0416_79]|nr:MAG: hypothetical protein Greene041679_34 [Parcubacteria group bacterium Greene0416_79]
MGIPLGRWQLPDRSHCRHPISGDSRVSSATCRPSGSGMDSRRQRVRSNKRTRLCLQRCSYRVDGCTTRARVRIPCGIDGCTTRARVRIPSWVHRTPHRGRSSTLRYGLWLRLWLERDPSFRGQFLFLRCLFNGSELALVR